MDDAVDEKGIKITDGDLKALPIEYADWHGERSGDRSRNCFNYPDATCRSRGPSAKPGEILSAGCGAHYVEMARQRFSWGGASELP